MSTITLSEYVLPTKFLQTRGFQNMYNVLSTFTFVQFYSCMNNKYMHVGKSMQEIAIAQSRHNILIIVFIQNIYQYCYY